MASYVVMEAPQGRDDAVYVRDGFHFLAFLVPPLWLLWHRLWIEALVAFAAMALLGALGSVSGLGEAAPLLSLLVSIYLGLEAPTLHVAALRRRGWSEWGVVDAANREEAEMKHLYGSGTESVEVMETPPPAAAPPPPPGARSPFRACAGAYRPGARPVLLSGRPLTMRVAIIDYGSGNLRSATKAFERAARESGIAAEIDLTDDADRVRTADRIVLPGVGAYADCRRGLDAVPGMVEAIDEVAIARGKPFLGICVGMQLMSERGLEKTITNGFGWIAGDVKEITPSDPALKIPQIGWNTIHVKHSHPLFDGIRTGEDGLHAYFVHSYHLDATRPDQVLATTDYGGPVTAAVARDNLAGTQFHPEKSQALGLALIANFLRWKP